MRRTLIIGLTLLISVAVLAGVRARYRRIRFQQAVVKAPPTTDRTEASAPIPEDRAAIENRDVVRGAPAGEGAPIPPG
jgi:hypothetical protein